MKRAGGASVLECTPPMTRSGLFRPLFAVALLSASCASAPPAQAARPPRTPPPNALSALSGSFEQLSARVGPSVVQIFALGRAPVAAGGHTVITKRRSTGSGVIVSEDGHIVTNAHVVQGAQTVRVLLAVPTVATKKAKSILQPMPDSIPAKIVGIDFETDLAVLKVDVKRPLPALAFADSDGVEKGQLVLAFGSPRGLTGSVTMGVVSAVARQLSPESPLVYLQTDAPINPGNSGGPLVDATGQVVGINTLILSDSGGSEGLGFAVPANIVSTVYRQIADRGFVKRGMIGVRAQTITPVMATALRIPVHHGVILSDVFPRGPGDVGGLKIGDIVLTLDGKRMENARQFNVNTYHAPIGRNVTVEVLRANRTVTCNVPVIERPDPQQMMTEAVNPEKNLIAPLGALGVDLTGVFRQVLPNLREPAGVLIAGTTPDAPGLQVGDVIHRVNEVEVTSLEQLTNRLGLLREGDPVVLQVERKGSFHYLSFRLE